VANATPWPSDTSQVKETAPGNIIDVLLHGELSVEHTRAKAMECYASCEY